jgi:anti-sigma factor RsiW
VSHLKDQLSALIDGELSGSELDRAHAHLAACAQCRAEAAALRDLKRELRNLAAEQPSEDLSRRLLAMATHDDAAPPRRAASAVPSPRIPLRAAPDRPGHYQQPSAKRPVGSRPVPRSPGDMWARRRRGRTLAWGALSFVVTVGIGAAAFSLGDSSCGRFTPQMELFSVEHAIFNGDVPLFDPSPGPRDPSPFQPKNARMLPLP